MFRVFIDSGRTNGVSTRLTERRASQSAIEAQGGWVGVSVVNKARWKKSELVKKKKMRPETFKRSFHVLYRQFNTLNSVAAYLYNVYIFLRLFMCVFSYLSMEIYQDQ